MTPWRSSVLSAAWRLSAASGRSRTLQAPPSTQPLSPLTLLMRGKCDEPPKKKEFTEKDWMRVMGIEDYKPRGTVIHNYERPEPYTGRSLKTDEYSVAEQERLLSTLRQFQPGSEPSLGQKKDKDDKKKEDHKAGCPCELCKSAPKNFSQSNESGLNPRDFSANNLGRRKNDLHSRDANSNDHDNDNRSNSSGGANNNSNAHHVVHSRTDADEMAEVAFARGGRGGGSGKNEAG